MENIKKHLFFSNSLEAITPKNSSYYLNFSLYFHLIRIILGKTNTASSIAKYLQRNILFKQFKLNLAIVAVCLGSWLDLAQVSTCSADVIYFHLFVSFIRFGCSYQSPYRYFAADKQSNATPYALSVLLFRIRSH